LGPVAHYRFCKEAIGMSKVEIIRRLRLGDLQKTLRSRYRHTLPDDDAGREDLFDLLLPISLGPEHGRRMKNAIEIWVPWMDADETSALIDRINRMPIYERKVSARRLGERMRITNEEREFLKLKTLKPFDMTDQQLKEQRRAKERARKKRARQRTGSKPREASLVRQKPWIAEGISRATWFRKRTKGRETNSSAKQKSHETNSSAIKLPYYRGQTSLTEQGGKPEGLATGTQGREKASK
jgi:hypothetical protein